MTGAGARRVGSRRETPRGEQRERLLLAALEGQLRTRPLADVSISDVTAAAGLGRSAFYFYFPSKEAAVTLLLGELFDAMLDGATAFLCDSSDPATGTRESLANLVDIWIEHQHLLLALVDASGANGDVRAAWNEWIDRFTAPLARSFDRVRVDALGPSSTDLAAALVKLNEAVLVAHVRAGTLLEQRTDVINLLCHIWTASLIGVQR